MKASAKWFALENQDTQTNTASNRCRCVCRAERALGAFGNMQNNPRKNTLLPGERCEWCGSVGETKTPPARARCRKCGEVFKKGEPWRILRGKRIHNPCPNPTAS